jgi:hypothetical protein
LLGRKSRLLCLTAAEWEKREAALPHGLRNGPGLSPEKSTTTKGPHKVRLLLASDTPIQRHVKVKCEANPYDPAFETYFEEREGFHMRETFRGTRTLRYMWNEQHGLCTVCKLLITRTTGWRLHHRVPLVRGGSKSAENRVLLHPECHDKVHRQNLSVSKPRLPQRGVRTACRMSTKVSRPVLRGPSLSNGAWLLGSNRSRHFSGTG